RWKPEHQRIEPAVGISRYDFVFVKGNELIGDRAVRAGRRAREGRSRTRTTERRARGVGPHVGPIDDSGRTLARKETIVGPRNVEYWRERKPRTGVENVTHPPAAKEFCRQPVRVEIRDVVEHVQVPVVPQVKAGG